MRFEYHSIPHVVPNPAICNTLEPAFSIHLYGIPPTTRNGTDTHAKETSLRRLTVKVHSEASYAKSVLQSPRGDHEKVVGEMVLLYQVGVAL